ncbi:uncharacterized protein PITG_15148 [Phytophthora infestans T30-4]|uniref:PiggyBac transposable element-derived protein domain-containing protein n=1 Tax=Phytophthora infestans (strain T30-4) TaxID=403677 RepID=D0NRS0_PHYIT|nr:uncharacterized protein PITG_15148 [Phytophthora infestans T30-4]EEY63420.1 conserved hypothetical protein [Phytophthora infestans T30-4]|eukprot:XP_002898305.1 conserved hypothetical protein [Phytophthora infestans T30-4]
MGKEDNAESKDLVCHDEGNVPMSDEMDVLDGVDTKKFKKLWSQLVKDGWEARPPTGLNVEHTYVKPGVKGKLRKDRVNADYFCVRMSFRFSRTSRLRASCTRWAAANGETSGVHSSAAQLPTAAPERDEHSDLGGQFGGVTSAAAAQGADGATPVAAAQGSDGVIHAATEQGGEPGGVTPVATEQGDEENSAFCDFDPDLEEKMDEVESDSDFEDEGEDFQQDDDEMKGIELIKIIAVLKGGDSPDFHSGMGGVDTHDQIRLQRYSIQRCVAFKKYYRQIFLAFIDMALVNAFTLYKIVMKRKDKRAPTHAEYMRQLHVELLAVTAISFRVNRHAEDLASVPTGNLDHVLRSTDELYKAKSGKSKGKSKSRQQLCKEFSALSPPKNEVWHTPTSSALLALTKLRPVPSYYFLLSLELVENLVSALHHLVLTTAKPRRRSDAFGEV